MLAPHSAAASLGWTAVAVVVPTLLRLAIDGGRSGVPFVTYFPAVVLVALFLGWRYGALAAALSAVVARLLFMGEGPRLIESPGGVAILQTPYSPVLHRTWSDPGIVEPQARCRAYGQEDHVRLYGRDIVDRFASVGLQPSVRSHAEVLPDVDPDAAGVNAAEPLMQFLRLG